MPAITNAIRKPTLRQFLGLTFGPLCVATALAVFLVPNNVVAGGVSGIATILSHITGLPVGVLMICCNVPLFFMGWRRWGIKVLGRSIYCAALEAVSVDIITGFVQYKESFFVGDSLLAALYGGVLCGFGIGLVFRSGGTTGGTDLLARLLWGKLPFDLGNILLMVDGIIVAGAATIFGLEAGLYAMITVFITGRMIDVIQEGRTYHKAVLIMSNQYREIADAIFSQMHHGITGLDSTGLYTGKERQALLCVVVKGELSLLKEIVYSVDSHAFIIVGQAQEVIGEGFAAYSKEKEPAKAKK